MPDVTGGGVSSGNGNGTASGGDMGFGRGYDLGSVGVGAAFDPALTGAQANVGWGGGLNFNQTGGLIGSILGALLGIGPVGSLIGRGVGGYGPAALQALQTALAPGTPVGPAYAGGAGVFGSGPGASGQLASALGSSVGGSSMAPGGSMGQAGFGGPGADPRAAIIAALLNSGGGFGAFGMGGPGMNGSSGNGGSTAADRQR